MSTSSTSRRMSLPQRIVSKAFQKLWRLTRGHTLRAEAFIWDEGARLLVSATGALPGTQVTQGEAAEAALRHLLLSDFGHRDSAVTLIAVTLVPSLGAHATSTHVAVFDVTWDSGGAVPDTYTFAELETLDGLLAPDLLTLARHRHCAQVRLAPPL